MLDAMLSELQEIETLRTAIKRRAMVYQIDVKEAAARRDGVPLETYFDLPYEQWMSVRDRAAIGPPPY